MIQYFVTHKDDDTHQEVEKSSKKKSEVNWFSLASYVSDADQKLNTIQCFFSLCPQTANGQVPRIMFTWQVATPNDNSDKLFFRLTRNSSVPADPFMKITNHSLVPYVFLYLAFGLLVWHNKQFEDVIEPTLNLLSLKLPLVTSQ